MRSPITSNASRRNAAALSKPQFAITLSDTLNESMPLGVFISWSGNKSHKVAQALREWLPLIYLDKIDPFLSSHDIAAGSRGGDTIASRLGQCRVGIFCLTGENLLAPWILFEAGAISKVVGESFVCTYLMGIDVSHLDPPLSQFQASLADKEGTKRIVETIHKALGESAPGVQLVERSFEAVWNGLKQELQSIESEPSDAPAPARKPEGEILEELVTMMRSQRLDGLENAVIRLGQQIQLLLTREPSPTRSSLRSEIPSHLSAVFAPWDLQLISDSQKAILVHNLEAAGLSQASEALKQSELSTTKDGSTVRILAPALLLPDLAHERVTEMIKFVLAVRLVSMLPDNPLTS